MLREHSGVARRGITMKVFRYFAMVLLGAALAASAQAQSACTSGQDDMLDFFTMRYPDRVDYHMNGNTHPLYTYMNPDNGGGSYAASGYFLWIKGVSGNPWDVKTWDTRYIYDRSTELSWS
jgi:hypothetical protein